MSTGIGLQSHAEQAILLSTQEKSMEIGSWSASICRHEDCNWLKTFGSANLN